VDATSTKYREASFWSGRGGDQIPQNFVEVEHHPVCASYPSSERQNCPN
jgi:hypothetical protein